MTSLELDHDHCIRCGRCVSVCPQRILGRKANGAVDFSHGALARCIRCGHCVAVCPKGVLSLNHVSPASLPLIEDAPLSDAQRDMLFKARRSVRAYRDEPVPHDVLRKALEEARYAPTASNCEEVEWLLMEGRERLHALASRVAEWMASLPGRYQKVGEAFRAGQDPILRGAPAVIFALGDVGAQWNVFDCSAAVTYLELALHSYGVGCCWSGFVLAAAANGVDLDLPIPEDKKICAGLMIGYPALRYARIPPRKPVRLTLAD